MSPETKTLRFYERQGLLPGPARTTASYRDFPPGMADRIGCAVLPRWRGGH
jgi:DNA-binding transcriptional MerR regulator